MISAEVNHCMQGAAIPRPNARILVNVRQGYRIVKNGPGGAARVRLSAQSAVPDVG